MKTLNELTAELMQNPEFKAAYVALAPEFERASTIIAARAAQGLTQEQLAERLNLSVSYIARLESGRAIPSMRTWQRLAAATGTRAKVTVTLERSAS
jgi:ribosome-binding protein aMBF1 (putative translation factor)